MGSKRIEGWGPGGMVLRVLVFAFSVTGASSLGAVSLVNGSFEDLSSSYVNTAGSDSMSNVAADGWTVSTNTPDWFLGAPGPAGLWLTSWGDHFTMGAAGGAYREGVSQTLTGLTIGQSYEIGFYQANGLLYDQANYEGVGNVGGWEVLIDGTPVLSSASVNDNSVPSPAFTTDWSASAVTFEATATSQALEFLAYDGSGGGPTFQFLDQVTVIPVPEPSAALLVLLWSIVLMARRRG